MAWRFHGRARVDPNNPQAFAVCDRCSFWYNHADLQWQYEWRGDKLQNLRLLVCSDCLDVPFELNRPLHLPPDPEPIRNARPENFFVDEAGGGGVDPEPAIYWNQPGAIWNDHLGSVWGGAHF